MRGTINYCVPIRERLHIDVRDFARTNMQFTPHEMPVRDARGIEDRISLDREGFALVQHRSAIAGSRDLEALGSSYHAEMQEMLKVVTGAREVLPQRTGLAAAVRRALHGAGLREACTLRPPRLHDRVARTGS